ncbi:hypothetical protein BRO54_3638 [Geobacillus proteiniphilus]|uniref:Uncharacterized protein n=1 Tax=Geobacillus proteiniphilus TaxID=860353 RepID=A0A1Q5SKM4_9BACL|nr:hypothetical protein BRO54_3638 [Geobacillus proteiniphilus]
MIEENSESMNKEEYRRGASKKYIADVLEKQRAIPRKKNGF